MIARILCAVDVERPAHAALRQAFDIAERFQASLDILHVQPEVEATRRRLATTEQPDMRAETPRERLESTLASVVTAIRGRARLYIAEDSPAAGILEHARQTRADLIVLGARSNVGDQGERVAEQVAYAASAAVLTVSEAEAKAKVNLGVEGVLLPVQVHSGPPEAILEWAAAFAHSFDVPVELLCVLGGTAAPGSMPVTVEGGRRAAHPSKAEAQLVELKEHLQRRGCTVNQMSVSDGDIVERTLERVRAGGSGLLVMAAHARRSGSDLAAPSFVAELRRRGGARVLSLATPGLPNRS